MPWPTASGARWSSAPPRPPARARESSRRSRWSAAARGSSRPCRMCSLIEALARAPTAVIATVLAAVVAGEEQEGAQQPAPEPEQPAREPEPEPQAPERGVPIWPARLTAHTVVLVTTSDRAAAFRVAKAARSTGLEAGLLPSDPYDLGTGLWLVYSGRFATAEGAQRQASELAERYPGAYAQLIQSFQ